MSRNIELQNEEAYHVFNRGVEKRDIFLRDIDYIRFLVISYFVNDDFPTQLHLGRFFKDEQNGQNPVLSTIERHGKKLVEILSWCLMPNHFHMLLRQLQENGVSIFLQRLQLSHSKYFNKVYKRTGVLFGGPFKAVHIGNDAQYTHVSRYIHLNSLEFSIHSGKNVDMLLIKRAQWSFLKHINGPACQII